MEKGNKRYKLADTERTGRKSTPVATAYHGQHGRHLIE